MADDIVSFDLKALRDHLGWSQEQLAEALCCERSSVSLYERGAKIPRLRLKELERIASENGFPSATTPTINTGIPQVWGGQG